MAIYANDSFVSRKGHFSHILQVVGNKNMHICVILKPCEITNIIYFFFVLGSHYPLFLEVDADEKEKMYTVISSLEHFTI